jgi:hypothetical protein
MVFQHRKLYLCLLLLSSSSLFLLCCFCCCTFVMLFLLLCCCFGCCVLFFDTGRAISLSRIPSNAIYRKPKFFLMAQHPLRDQGFLVIESSRSHSETHSVGLLWTNDQTNAEACTSQNTHTHTLNQQTDIYKPEGIRTRIPGQENGLRPTSESVRVVGSASSHFLFEKIIVY